MALAGQLYGTVSDETLFEILSTVTGIDPEVELTRIKEEAEEKPAPRRPEVDVIEDDQEDDDEEIS